MRRFLLAFRIFFLTLARAEVAGRVDELMNRGPALPAPEQARPAQAPSVPASAPPRRSEALTLLAALQREARFVDLIMEPLGQFSDVQIGAAARDVLRGCATVCERFFAIKPLLAEADGTPLELDAGFDAAKYRLTGNVSGSPPYRGRVVHPGWKAAKCELPTWSGNKESQSIVAAAEIEVQ